jgi:hypothetical protein
VIPKGLTKKKESRTGEGKNMGETGEYMKAKKGNAGKTCVFISNVW